MFGYILDYLKKYFGVIKEKKREDMYTLILDKQGVAMHPTQKHSIKDFKRKGAALCSEYATMAHNLLKLFGYDSYIILGTLKCSDQSPDHHAYNLIRFTEMETGEETNVLIDFLNAINVYDRHYNIIGKEPFIGYIDQLDEEFMDRLMAGEEHLEYNNYAFYEISDEICLEITVSSKKDYYVDKIIHSNTSVNSCKVYSYSKEICYNKKVE